MVTILLWIGIIFVIISGVFLGVWTSGDQQRANFHSETKEHHLFRTKVSLWSGLIGVICLGLAGLLYYVS